MKTLLNLYVTRITLAILKETIYKGHLLQIDAAIARSVAVSRKRTPPTTFKNIDYINMA